jgi:hypothetical protein
MRLNAVALYMMLPCSMVLLAFTSVSVKAQTPSLQGKFTLDAAASDDVNKAIEDAVKRKSFWTKVVTRSRLREINVSYKHISISFKKAEVSIAVDEHQPVRTPIDGPPVDWTREDGQNLKVTTVWESGKLKRTFKVKEGQRINTYTISVDGKTLTMQVVVTGTHLSQPLTYKLVYQRSN